MEYQLGGIYDFPYRACNDTLLPIVEEENAKNAPVKFRVLQKQLDMILEISQMKNVYLM